MPLSASFVTGNQEPANISGGTESFINNGADRLRAHTFTSNTSVTFNTHGEIKHILLVGGGGGGGDSSTIVSNPAGLRGGGGGGGEVKIIDSVFSWELTGGDDSVSSTAITIGNGGASGVNEPPSQSGFPSSIGPFTAAGGGGGSGRSGGSGGGGAGWDNLGSAGSATATGYQSFGNSGGGSSNGQHGAGGGGASQAGANGSAGGKGGDGYTWSVNNTTYGGGGGGGDNESSTSAGSGGAGGTGGGGWGRGNVPTGGTSQNPIGGTNGLGGGGGAGGIGGKGVVVLVVADPVAPVLTYSLSGSPSSVVEGNTSVFTVATGNVNNGTDLYWTVNNITTADNDFVATSGNITIQSDAATFNVDTVSGNVSGTETFNVSLRTGSVSGTIVATSNTISITEFVPAGSYPSWNTMPTYSEWQTEANLMSISGSVAYDMTGGSTISTDSDANMYAVSLPGGNVFIGPRDNPAYLWDYSAQTMTAITLTDKSGRSHLGPALAMNGNVVIPPLGNSQKVIEYDPSTGVSTSYTDSNLSTSGYYGATALTDGRVIFKPTAGGHNHRVWNTTTKSSSTTNIPNGIGFLHPNMVQHPKDGFVYMMPYRTAGIYKWDPVNDVYSQITLKAGSSTPSSGDAYQDAILGVDGKIYATPWSSGDIGIFDIDSLFFERYDPNSNIATNDRTGKGSLGNDGRIYMIPRDQDNIIVIPTSPADSTYGFSGDSCSSTVTRTNINSTIGSNNYWDGATDGDGNIICAPFNVSSSSNAVLRINPAAGNTIVHDFHLSPYTNNG